MPFTSVGSNLAVSYLFSVAAVTRPASWFVSLHSADPGLTGTNELTSANSPGYARQADTITVTANSATNSSAISFGPATAAWTAATHMSVWDASTAGRPLLTGQLLKTDLSGPNTVTLGVGDTANFGASALTFSLS